MRCYVVNPAPKEVEALTKDSLGTVFVHATRNLASERPTIVLIDDLHFAPEDARSLFMTLGLAVPGHPVLLVGTMRPGVSEEWVSHVTRLDHATHAVLSRLGPKDLFNLLGDSFGSERLANELAGQISVKSDGNPFFAFEIIRGLRESQFITQQTDGTWVSTQVIQDIQIPSSVLDLVSARISDLSQEERDLLDVASCCGFEFNPGMLASVVGHGRIPVLKSLAQIERAHRLIRSKGRHFVFDHHQVHEAIHDSLPEMLREEYHAAVADTLEVRENAAERDPAGIDGALTVDLCEHFLKGAQGERALRYLDAALDHLEARYLNDQMIALADRALEAEGLLEGNRRVEILLKKNEPLSLMGKPAMQEAALSQARRLAEQEAEQTSLAKVELATGALRQDTSRYGEARTHYDRARALFKEVGDRKGEANAMSGLGDALRWLSRYEEARAQHERALSIRREIGDKDGETTSTTDMGIVLMDLGRREEGRAHFESGIELARKSGNRLMEARTTGSMGVVLLQEGRFGEARARLDRAVGIAREIGARRTEALHVGNVALTFVAEGRSDEAIKRHERALTIAREVGNRTNEAVNLSNGGRALAKLGAHEESLARQRIALDIVREFGPRWREASTLMAMGSVLAEQGDVDAAEGLYKEALSHFEAMALRDDDAATAHLHYGVLLARLERTVEARTHLEEALAMAAESGAPSARVLGLVHLALLDGGASADAAEAAEALREGAKRLEHNARMEASFLLYKATGDKQHLEAAHDLLSFFVEHASEQYRESTLTNVRLHRDITKAWNEQASS